jgi:hypothetical protein
MKNKPVRKWKYTRKEINDELIDWDVFSFKGGNSTLNRIQNMLLAKPTKSSVGKSTEKEIVIGWDVGNDKDQSCIVYGRIKNGEIKITRIETREPKSTGKDGKRGKGDTTHCSPSTVNLRPTLKQYEFCKCNDGLERPFEVTRPTLKPIEEIRILKLQFQKQAFKNLIKYKDASLLTTEINNIIDDFCQSLLKEKK